MDDRLGERTTTIGGLNLIPIVRLPNFGDYSVLEQSHWLLRWNPDRPTYLWLFLPRRPDANRDC